MLLRITIHDSQVAGEPRQFPIARTCFGFGFFEIFRNRYVQLRARGHRPIDRVANRRHGAIAEEHHKLGGEPMAEPVLASICLETWPIFLEVENLKILSHTIASVLQGHHTTP